MNAKLPCVAGVPRSMLSKLTSPLNKSTGSPAADLAMSHDLPLALSVLVGELCLDWLGSVRSAAAWPSAWPDPPLPVLGRPGLAASLQWQSSSSGCGEFLCDSLARGSS